MSTSYDREILYSIVIPYAHRPDLFWNTLLSYRHWYKDRHDYEVVVVEDPFNAENEEYHADLFEVLKNYEDLPLVVPDTTDVFRDAAPSSLINCGVCVCRGTRVIITCPECIHLNDALSLFDVHFKDNPNSYAAGSCLCIKSKPRMTVFDPTDYEQTSWYQHSRHRNVLFPFCSCLPVSEYWRIGGYCEKFRTGGGYDDNDFIDRLRLAGIPLVALDSVFTAHQ